MDQQPTQSFEQPQSSTNQPQMQQPPRSVASKWIWVTLIIIVLAAGGYFGWYFLKGRSTTVTPTSTTSVKSGFKTVTGCVKPSGNDIKINFQLNVPEKFTEYTPPGSTADTSDCGQTKSQSNEMAYRIPGEINTIMVAVFITAGSSTIPDSMKNTMSYFPVPAPNDKYSISIQRDSQNSPSNAEWKEIVNSFSFK